MSEATISREQIEALAVSLCERAVGDEQVEVYAAAGRDTEVRVYQGEVESFSSASSAGLGVRLISQGRQGFSYVGSLDPELAVQALDEARDNARFATEDEANGLVSPDGVESAAVQLWDETAPAWADDDKIAMAQHLERSVRSADQRISGVESADVADSAVEVVLASTAGVLSSARRTACVASTWVLATEGDETQTGFGFSVGRGPADLDIERAAAEAAERATGMLGATKPSSGRFTVLLDPLVTAQLLGIVGSTLSGEAVLKQRSPFSDRVGELVAAPAVSLLDDPTDPAAFTASTIDAEGLACRPNRLISQGELIGFVHNGYTARRAGTRSTASAVRSGFSSTPGVGCRALRLEPGSRSRAELLAEHEGAVLIQSVSGLHSGVNPVSGDFSAGAEGRVISGGELGAPVREFTIASTLQRLLLDTIDLGSDATPLPLSATGLTLVVDGVSISGR